jgi:hypothetical protein
MFKVITLQDMQLWKETWGKLPQDQRSVYLLPEYYEIFEKLGYGEASCAIFSRGECLFLYPFLKRNLKKTNLLIGDKDYFDVEGAYGLNGAGAKSLEVHDKQEIEKAWEHYCNANHIIAEFVRFNPMLENNKFTPYLNPLAVSEVVVVDLTCADLMYESFEHSVRKNIKKAIKQNVIVNSFSCEELSTADFNDFIEIYYKTMDRNEAASFYYFRPEFFEMVKNLLPNNARWFIASVDGVLVSVELVLHDENTCFSFLGGTLPEHFNSGANVLLKNEIIIYFQKNGLKSFFLGGGVSPNDGILKYKKNFAKNSSYEFFIGKKVHMKTEYDNIVNKWEKNNPEKIEQYKNFLLKYWH